jgi:ketosteroid isomerase-like protein
MSRENVDLVRGMYREWERGQFGANPEVWDPDVRYRRVMDDSTEGVGLSGEWDGIAGLVTGVRLWLDAWADLRVKGEDFLDAGDKVVALTHQTGRARSSGLALDQRMADVWEIRDGKVVAFHSYWRRDDALEAVGLSE